MIQVAEVVVSGSPPVRIATPTNNSSSTPTTPSKFIHSHQQQSTNVVNNESNLRKSYELKFLHRLCCLASSSRHVSNEYTNAKASLESTLDVTKYLREQRSRLLEATNRISHIQRKLSQERSKLERKQNQVSTNEALIHQQREQVSSRLHDLTELRHTLDQKQVAINDLEVALEENRKSIEKRRSFLVKGLIDCAFTLQLDSQSCPTINGLRLPDSRTGVQSSTTWSWFPSRRCEVSDDEMSIAVGHVVHLLVVLTGILDIPLKYALNFYGSQSVIIDHLNIGAWRQVLGTGPANEIKVALYVTSKNSKDAKLYFEYGIYLLNQSIGQLKWTCGTILNKHSDVKKIDLTRTLGNLSDILSLYSVISDGDTTLDYECNLSALKLEMDSLLKANEMSLLPR